MTWFQFTRVALAVVATFACACSSSSSSGGGNSNPGNDASAGDASAEGQDSGGTTKVICYLGDASTPTCVIDTLTPSQAPYEVKACGEDMAQVVSSCPLTGLTGCCTVGANETCYYGGDASDNGCAASSWKTSP